MNIRFDDSILQDFGDLCSTFFSSTPMFSIEPISCREMQVLLFAANQFSTSAAALAVIHSILPSGPVCSGVVNLTLINSGAMFSA